jgi:excisionase family DNA binding protein
VGGTSNLLRDTGDEDGMNLEEVARDLKNARVVLGTIEARTLVGVAAILSEVTENLSRTAQRLERQRLVEWMDTNQAAAYLGISPGSFANAVASEGIPKHYFTGRKPKFSRQELDAWLMRR